MTFVRSLSEQEQSWDWSLVHAKTKVHTLWAVGSRIGPRIAALSVLV